MSAVRVRCALTAVHARKAWRARRSANLIARARWPELVSQRERVNVVRALLLFWVLVLAFGSPAWAEDPPVDAFDVRDALHCYEEGDAEGRALAVARVWGWLDDYPEATRIALGVVASDEEGYPRGILEAFRATTTPRPALTGGAATPEGLLAALRTPAAGDPFVAAVAYLRFTEALERTSDLDATLTALERAAPCHPWLAAVTAMRAKVALARSLAGPLERLGGPDPTSATRCVVRWFEAPPGAVSWPLSEQVRVTAGWLVRDDERTITLLTDVGRRLVISRAPAPAEIVATYGPLPRLERLDLAAESRAWLLAPDDGYPFGHAEQALVRAAWHARRGEELLAARLVKLAASELGGTDEELAARLRTCVADLAWVCALEALGAGSPRIEVAARLQAIIEVVEPAAGFHEDIARFLVQADRLRVGLEAQARLDARRPAAPSWATWQRWSPQERLACLLDHLRDEAATASGLWGQADPLSAQGRFPSDAPAGNATTRLRELGDTALPSLVALLVDLGPTRSIDDDRLGTPSDVVPLARVAEACLEALWCERLLDARDDPKDPLAAWRARQAQANGWLATWGERGLAAWHAARALAPGDEEPVRHAKALLHLDAARARDVTPRVYASVRGGHGGTELLRAIGEAGDPAYLTLLAGELEAEPLEAALGLARLGDPRGVARFAELSRAGVDIDLQEYERLAGAGAAEAAGRLLLERSNQAPWSDWRLKFASDPLPGTDALLVVARAAVRQRNDEDALRRLRERAGPGALADVVVVTLSDRRLVDLGRGDRAEHAAVTVLGLGLEAVRAYEARGGPPVRPLVLAALQAGAARADAAVDALGSVGRVAFEWACEGSDDPRRELLARAHLLASLRVRDAAWAEGEPKGGSFAEVYGLCWWCSTWDPGVSVAALLERWRADPDALPAFTLRIQRRADARGVDVRFAPAPAGPPGLMARVVAPGLDRTVDEEALAALMAELQAALERERDAPAMLDLTVRR